MESKPQILVRLTSGRDIVFDVPGHHSYLQLMHQLSRWFNCWIMIGKNAAVRKEDIYQVFYFPEGHAKDS